MKKKTAKNDSVIQKTCSCNAEPCHKQSASQLKIFHISVIVILSSDFLF